MKKLLSTKEVAECLGLSQNTIRKMRMRKNQSKYNFPKGYKIGGTIKYEKSENIKPCNLFIVLLITSTI
ncbi:helix-turn-helix transcriptional regulator [Campylobacter estrildidarum]|uniref:DNA-binding protein n=1 Tax=Campylobacter estrildidarum TaxID=2510189 RepID=A0A4U7BH82_9BACT|nr:helix-turn-helix domain-containing protein [Campylobacter estrildidarum]TKX31148.1 DNA-binding protein [Campylobacter estrildidarum]